MNALLPSLNITYVLIAIVFFFAMSQSALRTVARYEPKRFGFENHEDALAYVRKTNLFISIFRLRSDIIVGIAYAVFWKIAAIALVIVTICALRHPSFSEDRIRYSRAAGVKIPVALHITAYFLSFGIVCLWEAPEQPKGDTKPDPQDQHN